MTSQSPDVAVRALYDRLLSAWNRRDAHDYAELFAPDATVIGFDGSVMTGTDIERTIGVIFADHPTAAYVAKIRGVRPVGSHAILLHAIVGMIPPNGTDVNPAVNAHQILVAEQHSDAWRIVSFQNTPAQYHGRPDLVERHTREMRELLRQQTATT